MTSRQSKIDSIKRLLDPNSGATDGERQAAKAALERILKSQFGESGGQQRVNDFYVHIRADSSRMDEALARAFSGVDFVRKKQAGVDMSGEWTAETLDEALFKMAVDLMRRQIYQAFLYDAPPETGTKPHQPPIPKGWTREKPITCTEIVHATGRQLWDKHNKKENMKGN